MNNFFNKSLQIPASWKIKNLILSHLLVISLVCSVFYKPLYNLIWKALDEGLYKILSHSISTSTFWQDFWAVANHRIGDIIEDVFFLIFFLWLLKVTPRGEKLRKSAEFFFLALLTASVVIFINNLLFKQIVHIKRYSPSLILDSLPRLADYVSWIKVKKGAKACFPSDHSTTAVMFVANFFLLTKNRALLTTVALYGIFLCTPRLIAGAHWFTDVFCGSVSVVIILYGWALYTPFASICVDMLHKLFLWTSSLFTPSLKKV
jgi:Kdo2-lipid A phosphotransferase